MCRYDSLNYPDNINLWRLYANDGDGVALVYNFNNTNEYWQQLFLGKVIYGDEAQEYIAIKKMIDFHNEFNTLNENFINDYPDFVWMLLLLHKNKIWSIENEFRFIGGFLYDPQNPLKLVIGNEILNKNLFHTIYKQNIVSYIGLPLNFNYKLGIKKEEVSLWKNIPSISIEKVIIGYNVSDQKIIEIIKLLNYISESCGQKIPIEITYLRNELRS